MIEMHEVSGYLWDNTHSTVDGVFGATLKFIIGERHNICQDTDCGLVYGSHQPDLCAPLLHVILVNAKSISPDIWRIIFVFSTRQNMCSDIFQGGI